MTVDTLDEPRRARRRRTDAQHSIEAIVAGARTLLHERADASMEDIAAAAGLTRQTVYAHFPSRHTLIAAVINAERVESLAAVDASHLDQLPPIEALRRFLDISWQIAERCPLVLDPTFARTPTPDGSDPHRPVAGLLERIIRRGQRSGAFDRTLPAAWLAAATIGLGHTAAEQVAAGQLSITKATTLLDTTVLRLYGADPEHCEERAARSGVAARSY